MADAFTVVLTGQSLIHHDLRAIADSRFVAITDTIKAGDVAFTNFEMTVLGRHGGWPMKGSYFGCAPPEVLAALSQIGFNTLALANNHAFDLGPPGILSTLEETHALGFLHAGIGIDNQLATKVAEKSFGVSRVGLIAMDAGPGPDTMYVDNRKENRPPRPGVNRLKVARSFEVEAVHFDHLTAIQRTFQSSAIELANYAQPDDPQEVNGIDEINFYGTIFRRADQNARRIQIDRDNADAQLTEIRKAADRGVFVIAYLHHHHWEPDWRQVPEWVQGFARSCIEAGARIFVSHGAPVLQAIEIYRNSPIFYGLGNFIFHTGRGEMEWSPREVWQSAVATCTFVPDGELQCIELQPIIIGGAEALEDHATERLPFPVLAVDDAACEILDGLVKRCLVFGTSLVHNGNTGQIHIARPRQYGGEACQEEGSRRREGLF